MIVLAREETDVECRGWKEGRESKEREGGENVRKRWIERGGGWGMCWSENAARRMVEEYFLGHRFRHNLCNRFMFLCEPPTPPPPHTWLSLFTHSFCLYFPLFYCFSYLFLFSFIVLLSHFTFTFPHPLYLPLFRIFPPSQIGQYCPPPSTLYKYWKVVNRTTPTF